MKGILFKPDMIQAIRDKRKTVTRRTGGLKEINQDTDRWVAAHPVPRNRLLHTPYKGLWEFKDGSNCFRLAKPRYQVGETVYIKEVHYRFGHWAKNGFTKTGRQKWVFKRSYEPGNFRYIENPPSYVHPNNHREIVGWFKRSPLFMPAWAARYFIKITDVRAERLQEISWGDCLAEGIVQKGDLFLAKCSYTVPQGAFIELWDSINKDYQWGSNPWVWRYEFKFSSIEQ